MSPAPYYSLTWLAEDETNWKGCPACTLVPVNPNTWTIFLQMIFPHTSFPPLPAIHMSKRKGKTFFRVGALHKIFSSSVYKLSTYHWPKHPAPTNGVIGWISENSWPQPCVTRCFLFTCFSSSNQPTNVCLLVLPLKPPWRGVVCLWWGGFSCLLPLCQTWTIWSSSTLSTAGRQLLLGQTAPPSVCCIISTTTHLPLGTGVRGTCFVCRWNFCKLPPDQDLR